MRSKNGTVVFFAGVLLSWIGASAVFAQAVESDFRDSLVPPPAWLDTSSVDSPDLVSVPSAPSPAIEINTERSLDRSLKEAAAQARAHRSLLGIGLIALGPPLILKGFGQAVREDIRGESPGKVGAIALVGAAALCFGIVTLTNPWKAEDDWERRQRKNRLSLRLDSTGRGASLALRF